MYEQRRSNAWRKSPTGAKFRFLRLTDPHADVRAAASRWLHAWLADFNLSQVPPAADQVRQIHRLLALVESQLSPDAVKLVRLSVGSL